MTGTAAHSVDTGRLADLYHAGLAGPVCDYLHAISDRHGAAVANRLLGRLMVAVHNELGRDFDIGGLIEELEDLR
jgi:hypothetical protein